MKRSSRDVQYTLEGKGNLPDSCNDTATTEIYTLHIVGSVSVYKRQARKYALNGLFCIDDNKDSDSTNTHGKEGKSSTTNLSAAQIRRLYTLANNAGYDKAKIEQMISTKYKNTFGQKIPFAINIFN